MKYVPYEYQRTAHEWIIRHPYCCLFLDMGLGKTVTTLTALRKLMDWGEVSRVLVVAPKKVAETTWTTEAAKWDHLCDLRVVKVAGTERRRRQALETPADVFVLGRDNFVWLAGLYNGRLPFDAVVLDELTGFKGPSSRRFKAMRLCRKSLERVIGLTGTPAPNGLKDLWGQLCVVDGGERLGTAVTRFREAYFDCFRRNNIIIRMTPKRGAADAIRRKIEDICLSMQSKDYLQLPPLLVHDVRVELSPAVMGDYMRFERDMVLALPECSADKPVTAASAAALMNKLSQYANGAVYDDDGAVRHIHDEKLEALAELVEGAAGSPVLVFYQYRHDIPRILERFKDLRTAVYEGAEELHRWNAGEIDVLLAHPASTAYGLNMQQGGHYIAWYGLGWNLELYQQANARLYRQGQEHPVIVYRLVCAGTVDERAAAALAGKSDMQQSLLDNLKYLIHKHNGKG